jgi:hypothetical protein
MVVLLVIVAPLSVVATTMAAVRAWRSVRLAMEPSRELAAQQSNALACRAEQSLSVPKDDAQFCQRYVMEFHGDRTIPRIGKLSPQLTNVSRQMSKKAEICREKKSRLTIH